MSWALCRLCSPEALPFRSVGSSHTAVWEQLSCLCGLDRCWGSRCVIFRAFCGFLLSRFPSCTFQLWLTRTLFTGCSRRLGHRSASETWLQEGACPQAQDKQACWKTSSPSAFLFSQVQAPLRFVCFCFQCFQVFVFIFVRSSWWFLWEGCSWGWEPPFSEPSLGCLPHPCKLGVLSSEHPS